MGPLLRERQKFFLRSVSEVRPERGGGGGGGGGGGLRESAD